jgi:hypothetical protein
MSILCLFSFADRSHPILSPRLPRRYSNDKLRDTSAPKVGTSGSNSQPAGLVYSMPPGHLASLPSTRALLCTSSPELFAPHLHALRCPSPSSHSPQRRLRTDGQTVPHPSRYILFPAVACSTCTYKGSRSKTYRIPRRRRYARRSNSW